MHIIKLNNRSNNKKKFELPLSWDEFNHGDRYHKLLDEYFINWFEPNIKDISLKIGGLSCQLLEEKVNEHINISILEKYPSQTLPLIKNNYNLVADIYNLPFNPELIPINHIFLIHTLNFSADPYKLLREVDRIISDDGYLYISLFNPFNFMLRNYFLGTENKNPSYRLNKLFFGKILDGLKLLNYKIVNQQVLVKNQNFPWLNKYFADLICIVAKKQTIIPNVRILHKKFIKEKLLVPNIYQPEANINYQNNKNRR